MTSASSGRASERQRDRDGLARTTAPDDRACAPRLAGRDRPEALRGVHAVGVDVERVVQVVGAARGEAEADERDRGVEQRPRVRSSTPGRARCGEHEHVLDPLLRPRQPQRAPRRRLRRGSAPGSVGTGASGSRRWLPPEWESTTARPSSGSHALTALRSRAARARCSRRARRAASAGTPRRMRSEQRDRHRERRDRGAGDEAELDPQEEVVADGRDGDERRRCPSDHAMRRGRVAAQRDQPLRQA